MACNENRFDANCDGCRHCADCPPTPGAPTYVWPSDLAETDRRIRESDRRRGLRDRLIGARHSN